MTDNVIRLPRRRRKPPKDPKPRQRVFHLGVRYVGPPLCQDLQHVYLKRHPTNEWGFLHYSEGFSFEFERCDSWDLMERIYDLNLTDNPTEEDLISMGWRDLTGPNVFEFPYYYEEAHPELVCFACGRLIPASTTKEHACVYG